jgi:dTDP-3-amino-3,4,6-trideoxy-alpha-D-glucose transaminase
VLANDFQRQWADIRDDAMAAVERVGESGWLILGEEVATFERELAAWWGVEHAVGVASGMDALEIGLRCVGVTSGDRVLTTPLTAFATTLAILRAGAEPVWCDVDATGALDLELAGAALAADSSIRFVLPVHLYGHPMDLDALAALARDHEVTLVEDCAQSAGAERDGRPTGSVGAVAGTSLYPTKNLGALGDGGVVLTNDPAVAATATQIRDYGQQERYRHVLLGLNSRLDELHAAILRSAQMPRLSSWIDRRRQIAHLYAEGLADGPLRPVQPSGGASSYHLFPVEVEGLPPSEVAAALRARGIVTGRHYPMLCPDQPAARSLGVRAGEMNVARRIAERELSLPLHPYLRDEEVELVLDACAELAT